MYIYMYVYIYHICMYVYICVSMYISCILSTCNVVYVVYINCTNSYIYNIDLRR